MQLSLLWGGVRLAVAEFRLMNAKIKFVHIKIYIKRQQNGSVFETVYLDDNFRDSLNKSAIHNRIGICV